MADPQALSALSLEIRRVINAPREKVYAAWTDPDLFARWFAPENHTCSIVEMDLRPGGAYRVAVKPADDLFDLLPEGRQDWLPEHFYH